MWSIETDQTFPLSSVKPFDGLTPYRARCVSETRLACAAGTRRRATSPVSGSPLLPAGAVEGFEYLRCPDTGSLFLAELAPPASWSELLSRVSRYRQSSGTFHAGIAEARQEHVHSPKLEWIRSSLRMQGMVQPAALHVATPPSEATGLLEACGAFRRVTVVNEMDLGPHSMADREQFGAAVLFESLDRVDDPAALLAAVHRGLLPGGLVFVTALVCSGFDVAALGLKNLYVYPPDRTNCFSLSGLERLLQREGFVLLEVSTPGVLDVEIVQTHLRADPALPLSEFERQVCLADQETRQAFQTFLQQNRMSSFARLIGRKNMG